MKLFNTGNILIVQTCQYEFEFELPSVLLERRSNKFLSKLQYCENQLVQSVLGLR